MPLTQAARTYQHALTEWRSFRSRTFAVGLLQVIRHPATTDPAEIAAALRVLPAGECRPVAFAIALRTGGGWSQGTVDGFLDEFLPDPSALERQMLDAAFSRRVTIPENLPATVEDFPSRIWCRALASQHADRLLAAAFLATDAMDNLLVGAGCHEEADEAESEDAEAVHSCRVPVGDLDSIFDLVGIPPARFAGMKNQVMDAIVAEIEAGSFPLYDGQGLMVRAWATAGSDGGSEDLASILEEALRMREEVTRYGGLRARFRTLRYGRFLLRLGLRREAMRCARAIGKRPWENGWQHQSLSAAFHARIRRLIIKPGMVTDRWLTDPALACSCMSAPLWLQDGICRLPELTALFSQAPAFPWLYPRLQQIFQWHLALAGDLPALCEIAEIDPQGQVGLAML